MDIFSPYGGRLLSVDEAPEVLEGVWGHTRTVLLEFPSEEQAHAWYDSPAYRNILPIRHRSATSRVFIMDGFTP